MRCGSCNEVFDGNAALLEPLPTVTPLPALATLPESVQALSLDFDDAAPAPTSVPLSVPLSAPMSGPTPPPVPVPVLQPEPAPAAASSPAPEPAPTPDPAPAPELTWVLEPEPESAPTAQDLLGTDTLTDEELQAALEAELAALDARMAAAQPAIAPALPLPPAPAARTDERREPTFEAPDRPYQLEQDDERALLEPTTASRTAPRDDIPPSHTLLRTVSAPSADRYVEPQFGAEAAAAEPSTAAHTFEPPAMAIPEPAPAVVEDDEPGFMKRGRRRERYGRATTIALCLGVLLLLGALVAQGLTTFRNPLAASVPSLKPVLTAACQALGCKIELPTRIDVLAIEQGELQTLNDTTFSLTTALRNAGKGAQQWPHIELVLDDANDKTVLRRVFAPRDYLAPGTAVEQGFPARSEQSVKLYFELKQLKASGYHIAVFYP